MPRQRKLNLSRMFPPEYTELLRLEGVVRGYRKTNVDTVGTALGVIRDKRLYRHHPKGYKTWEAYCREEWDWGRSYANKLIAAARSDLGTMVPTERVRRELVRLPPAMQQAVLRQACEVYGDQPTYAQIHQTMDEMGIAPNGKVVAEEVVAPVAAPEEPRDVREIRKQIPQERIEQMRQILVLFDDSESPTLKPWAQRRVIEIVAAAARYLDESGVIVGLTGPDGKLIGVWATPAQDTQDQLAQARAERLAKGGPMDAEGPHCYGHTRGASALQLNG
jgi:hypothetical protein